MFRPRRHWGVPPTFGSTRGRVVDGEVCVYSYSRVGISLRLHIPGVGCLSKVDPRGRLSRSTYGINSVMAIVADRAVALLFPVTTGVTE